MAPQNAPSINPSGAFPGSAKEKCIVIPLLKRQI